MLQCRHNVCVCIKKFSIIKPINYYIEIYLLTFVSSAYLLNIQYLPIIHGKVADQRW